MRASCAAACVSRPYFRAATRHGRSKSTVWAKVAGSAVLITTIDCARRINAAKLERSRTSPADFSPLAPEVVNNGDIWFDDASINSQRIEALNVGIKLHVITQAIEVCAIMLLPGVGPSARCGSL